MASIPHPTTLPINFVVIGIVRIANPDVSLDCQTENDWIGVWKILDFGRFWILDDSGENSRTMKMLPVSFFSLVLPALSLAQLACPPGYSLVNQAKCLKIYKNSVEHLHATLPCTSVGGTLATVKNAVDNRALATIAASAGLSDIWLGLYCVNPTGQNATCYHDDSSGVMSYSNFAPGTVVADDSFVSMTTSGSSTGQWKSTNVNWATHAYVCEVPVTIADPTCKYNFNGFCYLPSHEIPNSPASATFPRAQAICNSNNASLVSIHSKQEVDFIRSIYNTSTYDAITLGAQALQPHIFTWVDGSSFDFDFHNPYDNFTGNSLQMVLKRTPVRNIYANVSGLWSEANGQVVSPFLCMRKIGDSAELESLKTHKFPTHYDLSDPSNCNNTLLMAPGVITSFGYGTVPTPAVYCKWKVATVGAYQLALHFTDVSVFYSIDVVASVYRFSVSSAGSIAFYGNSAVLSHSSNGDQENHRHGFQAVAMPL